MALSSTGGAAHEAIAPPAFCKARFTLRARLHPEFIKKTKILLAFCTKHALYFESGSFSEGVFSVSQ
jgi:hypothetical protein